MLPGLQTEVNLNRSKLTLGGTRAVPRGKRDMGNTEGPLCPVNDEASFLGSGKVPGDDCPLVWGQCSHCFHMHCILKWLNAQQVQQHCPMCRQEWKFKE
uniref:anaphase-promoting complex subunit 11 isoform X1 n=1 Tax=Halichoerus grypus TaxID=9711 RepID=UPI0016596349|nr:anaphase-promoting complex subunit 11 isoform X1 [Halichoerus grypus]